MKKKEEKNVYIPLCYVRGVPEIVLVFESNTIQSADVSKEYYTAEPSSFMKLFS